MLKTRTIVSLLKRLGFLFLAFLKFHSGAFAGDAPSEFQERAVNVAGVERQYTVHYPTNKTPQRPGPLVIVLHGAGGASAENLAKWTGLDTIADREGFIVVYPSGLNGRWNDGRGETFRRSKQVRAVDDVGFMRSLIDGFIQRGEADASRVYVTGVSNGGMMAYRLGIELGAKLAAVAAVIANLPANLAGQQPERPLPVLIMNGTADPIIPWNGGEMRTLGISYGKVISTEDTVKYWVAADRLPLKSEKKILPDRDPRDNCRVEVDAYGPDVNGREVVLYTIKGGGHTFPGSKTPDRPRMLGAKCMDINGAEVIWEFFKKHSISQPHNPKKQNNP
ncbi:MAG: dienelactone hydrolase family protein [Desulfobacteraceae bacterium]|nr:dienelactone hydrolase family protein [Desulfobacteraceae bacterium]